ncbi:MAG: proline--tRNA ligase [Betaproteobacteria bacterium]|nr:proline--tRNA ligase [Betaproteobacteria bacterium]
MRASHFFLSTLKEAPAEAELVSHRLMLRAGYIKKLGSGLYTWMPLGLRVLRKIEAVVRDEMNAVGALEVLMPAVQPAELWQETGRWDQFGPQMLKIRDRHAREFCFGPTHEEVVTDVVRREIKSYRQLPLTLYQIQTKFRDEIRPRFGVMRAREFVMKDAYSFHADFAGLQTTYQSMYAAYSRIFTRLGLKFRAVAADTGAIGGSGSHEFHVLADSGEDAIAWCPQSDYAANIELAEAVAPIAARGVAQEVMRKIPTPGHCSIEAVSVALNLPAAQLVKTLLVQSGETVVALLLRGDHQLNEIKAAKVLGQEFRLADEAVLRAVTGCAPGSIGPVGLSVRVIADRSVVTMSDFVCGANEEGYHWRGVNFGRDLPEPEVADLRNVVAGDPSPDGQGELALCRGIEVGHIFQLRTTYSAAMSCQFLDEQGQSQVAEMGCYGIGVSRIVAAAIEQNFDDRGMCLPAAIAPFTLVIVPVGLRKSEAVREMSESLYVEFSRLGIDVLLDDRDERLGVMFAEMELIGIPHRLVVGERALATGEVEYQGRTDSQAQRVSTEGCVAWVLEKLKAC